MIRYYKRTDMVSDWAKTRVENLAAILREHSIDRAVRFLASHYVWDYIFILSQLEGVPYSGKVLDAGGGHGALQFYLARRYQTWNVDRNDFKEEVEALNFTSGTDVCFVQSELSQMEYPDGCFDCIVSCSALEHNPFEDTRKAMKELARVLKPGGKLIMTLVGWHEDIGYREFAENDLVEVYTDEKIKALLEGTGLVLSGESNFDEIMLCIIQFYQTYPGYDHPWIPVGLVAEKK